MYRISSNKFVYVELFAGKKIGEDCEGKKDACYGGSECEAGKCTCTDDKEASDDKMMCGRKYMFVCMCMRAACVCILCM